ncbi:hypothetical protein [Massilia sp. TS11]|uniref:hypothetical protein n=1 Tax=Massilia sp. TS11 TaxID=2908003 RepID=UPI001EDC7E60|nr:hypothetical protein [Massilia sp. TS11]MCG2586530.1 hypothetical protein [Massilia sp. TS11]
MGHTDPFLAIDRQYERDEEAAQARADFIHDRAIELMRRGQPCYPFTAPAIEQFLYVQLETVGRAFAARVAGALEAGHDITETFSAELTAYWKRQAEAEAETEYEKRAEAGRKP